MPRSRLLSSVWVARGVLPPYSWPRARRRVRSSGLGLLPSPLAQGWRRSGLGSLPVRAPAAGQRPPAPPSVSRPPTPARSGPPACRARRPARLGAVRASSEPRASRRPNDRQVGSSTWRRADRRTVIRCQRGRTPRARNRLPAPSPVPGRSLLPERARMTMTTRSKTLTFPKVGKRESICEAVPNSTGYPANVIRSGVRVSHSARNPASPSSRTRGPSRAPHSIHRPPPGVGATTRFPRAGLR